MLTEHLLSFGAVGIEKVGPILVELRKLYNYPRAYCKFSSTRTEFQLTKDLWILPVAPEQGEVTDVELDSYHLGLLNSANPLENLLGTTSIIFWGYYTFSENYALERVRRHLNGYRGKPATTPSMIGSVLNQVRENKSDLGLALSKLGSISQLSRTPFASKVVGHMFPQLAGVYDNQISLGLERTGLDISLNLHGGIGAVSNKEVQKKYGTWCRLISDIANGLNKSDSYRWTDNLGVPQRWRSIDVERSLFQYFKTRSDVAV